MDFVAPFTCPPRKPEGDCHAQICDGLYRDRVNAHVLYQTPPLHYSQNNRTLFSNDFVWEQAYIYLSEQVQQLQCNLSAGVGTEAARTLNLHYNSVQCTAANAKGVCTAWYMCQRAPCGS